MSEFPEELEIGVRCARIFTAENLGLTDADYPLFLQTMKFFGGKLVLMTEKGLQACNHLTWQQSIYDFQKATSVRTTKQLGEASEEDEDLV